MADKLNWLRHAETSLVPIMLQSTVPFVGFDDRGGEHQVATATLLRLGDRSFAVTAAHFLFGVEKLELSPILLCGHKEIRPASGQIHRLRPRESNNDPAKYDVGVWACQLDCAQVV